MSSSARVFRTGRPLQLALGVAGVFWAVCSALLISAAPRTAWGCAAFAVFFFAALAHHACLRIAVDERGLRYRSLRRRLELRFEDIVRVTVAPAFLLRVYIVFTRRGLVVFSSHVKGHGELCELLLARAGLDA